MSGARPLLRALPLLALAGLLCGEAAAKPLCADTNGDGARDAADALRLRACASDESGCDADAWDTNLDGVLDARDAERVLACDTGPERCTCRANTLRVLVLPDQQCIVGMNSGCLAGLAREKFGLKKADKPRSEYWAQWRELLETPAWKQSAEAYLEERLDVLDRTVRGILSLRPPPDLILNVGDSINAGEGRCEALRPRQRERVPGEWRQFLDNRGGRLGYRALLDSGIPVATAQGNHDECGFERQIPGAGPGRLAGATSFDAKTGAGLALARHWGARPAEMRWLRGQLAAHSGGPVFFVAHDTVVRVSDENCRWLGEPELHGLLDRVAFVTGGHYITYNLGCKEVEGGRLLSYANFQSMPQGGQGYLVEVRFWPLDEPAFPRGSFEVRTWSPALGQSWHEPGMTNRGHSLSGQLDWSRFD